MHEPEMNNLDSRSPGTPEPHGPEVQGEDGRMGFADLIYGILFKPTATFRRISADPPLFYGFLTFLIVVVLTSLASSLIPPDVAGMPPELGELMSRVRPYLGILGAIMAFIGWFIQAGVLQVTAEFLGGSGRALSVLTVLALADIPRVLVIPFQLISYYTANSFLGRFLTVAISLIVLVWWAVLLVIGLREMQHYSTGRAVATLAIPLSVIVIVMVILIVALVGMAIPFAA